MRKWINLIENPIGNIHHIGDFSKEGSFDMVSKKDRELLNKPEHMVRLRKLVTNNNVLIDCYFVNMPTDKNKFNLKFFNNFPAGEYSIDDIKKAYGFDIKPRNEAISFVLWSNFEGTDSLSAWMILHRFMHLLDFCYTERYPNTSIKTPELVSAIAKFDLWLNDDIEYYQNISTMRSAKNNNIAEGELTIELLTQYLAKGKITFSDDKEAEDTFNDLAEKIFSLCKGKIFSGI